MPLSVSSDAAGPDWSPPSYVEVLAVSHILELPQDIQVPSDTAVALTEERKDVFQGWSDDVKTAFTNIPIETPGQSPLHRLVVRNAIVRTAIPLQAADHAFAEWEQPLMSSEAWEQRQRAFRAAVATGWEVRKSVVAASTFIAPDRWRSSEADRVALMLEQLDASLDFVNDYIVSLSLLRGDPLLGPVARGDLPPLCPVIIEGGRRWAAWTRKTP